MCARQISAVVVYNLFITSYVTYHLHHGTTRFAGEGLARPIYFTILISHTILAIAIVPLVAVTLYRALHADFLRHSRIARLTFPLCLYVSGIVVVVYLILYRIYASG